MPPTKKDKGKARRKKGQAAKAKPQKRKGGRVQVKGVSVTPFRLQVLALCAQVRRRIKRGSGAWTGPEAQHFSSLAQRERGRWAMAVLLWGRDFLAVTFPRSF